MSDTSTEYQVRLRHVHGDLGPFTLPASTTMVELGELACSQWPEGESDALTLLSILPRMIIGLEKVSSKGRVSN